MKRLAVISLLPLLLFNTLGYYLVFYGDILSAKHEAEVYIWGHDSHSEKMVTLTFPMQDGKPVAEGLTFTEGDEFQYQGRMYDIASSKRDHDKIILTCYTDIREIALNNDLRDKVNADNDHPSQNHKNNSVLKEFAKDYTVHTSGISFLLPVTITSYCERPEFDRPSNIDRSTISPPPEV